MTRNKSYNYNSKFDWWSIAIYLVLLAIGLLSIHSASYDGDLSNGFGQRSVSQAIWIVLSICIATCILFINKDFFYKITVPLYLFSLLVHIFIIFFGDEINGAKSWIRIGSIGIQPAEFGKFITALMLARILSDYDTDIKTFKGATKAILIMLLPMAIIILQNDTGSALVYGGFVIVFYICGLNSKLYTIFFTCILLFITTLLIKQIAIIWILYIATVLHHAANNRNHLKCIKYVGITVLLYLTLELIFFWWDININSQNASLIAIGATLIIPIWYAQINRKREVYKTIGYFVGWYMYTGLVKYVFENILKLHQQKRILDLLGLESDLQGWGYNVNQSMIAIGSGGLIGKGYMNGTQTKYDFVPEQATDFIFCTIGEEGGFIMATITIILFTALILRLLKMASKTNDYFARIYTYGVVSIISIHAIVNIGMTIGVVPVIGIPLPFISYGGSSLISFTIMLFIAIKMCAQNKVKSNKY